MIKLAGRTLRQRQEQLGTWSRIMQTANPVLSDKTFDTFSGFASPANTMTVGGTVNKTGVLLACVLATAAWTWSRFSLANPAEVMPYMIGGGIVGLVLA